MNLQELKARKQELIIQGREAYPDLVKIVDTLGETKFINGRYYKILEHGEITMIFSSYITKAKVGNNYSFQRWLLRSNLFVTVGKRVELCPFRKDRVMFMCLDNETTEVTQADRDNEIFVPYHMDWYNKIMTLLPKAESILGQVSHNESQAEIEKLSKELFLEERK